MGLIDEIWADDLLNRKSEAYALIDFLIRRHHEHVQERRITSYVLNLDSDWGFGKTFFVDHLAIELAARGYLVASINAWRDDATNEPMVAVMAAIEKSLKPLFNAQVNLRREWEKAKAAAGPIAVALAKGIVKRVATKLAGEGVDEAVEIFNDVDFSEESIKDETTAAGTAIANSVEKYLSEKIRSYEKKISSVDNFKKIISNTINISQKKNVDHPLFVIIDELDRCRPLYAIELLEQVKHLFDIPEIIFIISTDRKQLSHAIGAIYGERFDGSGYLRRFFSRQYNLSNPERDTFVKYLFEKSRIDSQKMIAPLNFPAETYFSESMSFFDMGLRDTEQCFDLLRSMCTVWSEPIPIQLPLAIPLIVFYHTGDRVSTDVFFDNGRVPALSSGKLWATERNGSEISMIEMINQCREFSQHSLPEISQSQTGNFVSQSIRQPFTDEFAKLHFNSYKGNRKPFSIVKTYPERIMSAGRMTLSE